MENTIFLEKISQMRQHNGQPFKVTLQGIVTGYSISTDEKGKEKIVATVNVLSRHKDDKTPIYQNIVTDISEIE